MLPGKVERLPQEQGWICLQTFPEAALPDLGEVPGTALATPGNRQAEMMTRIKCHDTGSPHWPY